MNSRPTWLMALACGALASVAHAQWTDDASLNTPVVINAGDQTVVKTGLASDGSSWTGWFDFGYPNVQVRVQRLDADGNRVFAPEGLLVSNNTQGTSVVDWDLGVDDEGNCMLTFVDIRAGGDNDVYAYLISPSGESLWGPNGVIVSDNGAYEADPRICRLSGGDYVVTWPRFQTDPGIVMQRISPAGVKAFAGDGVRIAFSGTEAPAFHEMIPTADNGIIVSWVRNTATFSSPRHVRAGKFNADAQPVWAASPVTVSDATVVPIAHRPRLISDGAGGAIIGWHDTREGDFNCFVQRLDASGNAMFAEDGVSVSSEFNRQQLDPAIAMNPSGDIMVFFRNLDGTQSQQSLNVQSFNGTTGVRQFGDAGSVLLPFDGQYKSPPRALTHAAGAAAVLDQQPVLGSTNGNLKLLIADEESGALVGEAAFPVSTVLSSKGRLNFNGWSNGRMLATWSDSRNGGEDIYAQIINADGSLGGSAGCAADITGDGNLNFFDLAAYLDLFNAGDPAADLAPPFGTINFFDLAAYLDAFNAGCP